MSDQAGPANPKTFIAQVLSDQGNTPSSKRLIALVSSILGFLLGFTMSAIIIAGIIVPGLLASIPVSAVNTVTLGINFIQWFIMACFTLTATCIGLTLPEWWGARGLQGPQSIVSGGYPMNAPLQNQLGQVPTPPMPSQPLPIGSQK